MANAHGKFLTVSSLITMALVGAGLIANYTMKGEAIANCENDVVILKAEGCDVSRKNEKAIIGMQKDVEGTAETVEQMSGEQTKMRDDLSEMKGDITYIRAAFENERRTP